MKIWWESHSVQMIGNLSCEFLRETLFYHATSLFRDDCNIYIQRLGIISSVISFFTFHISRHNLTSQLKRIPASTLVSPEHISKVLFSLLYLRIR